METTTQTGTPSGVPSAPTSPAAGSEEAFGNLWDAMERAEAGQPPLPPEAKDVEDEPSTKEAQPPEASTKEAEEPKAEEAKPEEKEYESLDAYLADAKLDKDTFMRLPLTVKVDGKEDPVSLAELRDAYQLKSASYNRMNELAQERAQFTQEQAQVRQALGMQIQRTEALLKAAQEQLLGDYARVTPEQLQQLRMEKPGEYAAFITDYNARVASIQQLAQQADQARQEQARVADKQRLASLPQEQAKLLAAIPEWRDPAVATAAQKAMRDYGSKLGFTDAELNAIYDHRYMQVLHDAARYRQLQASQNATLTRVRSAPKMAKPGTRTNPDPKRSAYQQAKERLNRDPRNEDAQAAVFEHLAQ